MLIFVRGVVHLYSVRNFGHYFFKMHDYTNKVVCKCPSALAIPNFKKTWSGPALNCESRRQIKDDSQNTLAVVFNSTWTEL